MDLYVRGIKKPFSEVKKLVAGVVFNIIPVVNFISIGYVLENGKFAMGNKAKLPEWNNIWHYFKLGFKGAVISFVYFIPVWILLSALMGMGYLWYMARSVSVSSLNQLELPAMASNLGVFSLLAGGGVLAAITALLLVGIAYFLPVALLKSVNEGNLSAAFHFKEVALKALNENYIFPWAISMLYCLLITLILIWIPLVGLAFGSFVGGLSMLNILGEVYKKL